jgi:hypothetical protein
MAAGYLRAMRVMLEAAAERDEVAGLVTGSIGVCFRLEMVSLGRVIIRAGFRYNH